MSYQQTLNILANGSPEKRSLGAYTYVVIRAANVPTEISFDGQVWQPAGKNDSFGPLEPAAQNIYFRAASGLAGAVTFAFGLSKIVVQDTAQSNASHYALGNINIAVGAAANAAFAGSPACDANGYLQITNAMQLAVSGVNNSHRRQLITFDVSPQSPASLNVTDTNGKVFYVIPAGQARQIVTDADLVISGAGGTAWAAVGQLFLNS